MSPKTRALAERMMQYYITQQTKIAFGMSAQGHYIAVQELQQEIIQEDELRILRRYEVNFQHSERVW